MATLTKQLVHANWYILGDWPKRDGEYIVCFLKDNGDYGWPEVWEFTTRDGWEPISEQEYSDQPTHWCDLPMPR
jgi:hypothetical protein